jgi:DICT domain-containing protein
VRPKIERRDLSNILRTLNDKERNRDGVWQADSREMTSAAKYLNEKENLTSSTLTPDDVIEAFTTTTTKVASTRT